ncbi:MAG TPA: TetR/AcrR family transcriptional regulator [Spongiibacteraceae bacterium]
MPKFKLDKRDSADARTRILDAAAKAFVAHGYSHTRLSEIAKIAGVSRSTLYENFPGKEQLLVAINHQVIAESLAVARDTLHAGPSAAEAIRLWLRTSVLLTDRYRTLLKIMHSDEVQPSLLIDREATMQSISDAQKWVRQVLRRGIKSGELRADISINRTAHSLQSIHYLLTKQAAADYPLFEFGADAGELAIDLVIRGLQG